MLNQRIIDIYRFVEKTISPSNFSFGGVVYVKIKNNKIRVYIKNPFKDTENSQNFEGVNYSMLMYLLK